MIRADTAFVMTNMLRGVLSLRGTGARAAAMASQWPLAGKTGTVDDNTDAWFVGFDPDITVGVWLGYDDKRKSLGGAEQGAFAALPIWMEFMKDYIAQHPDKDNPPEFAAPGNIVFLAVDQGNGSVRAGGRARHDPRSLHLRHPARREHVQPTTLTRPRRHEDAKDARRRKPIGFSSCSFFVPSSLLVASVATGPDRSSRRFRLIEHRSDHDRHPGYPHDRVTFDQTAAKRLAPRRFREPAGLTHTACCARRRPSDAAPSRATKSACSSGSSGGGSSRSQRSLCRAID